MQPTQNITEGFLWIMLEWEKRATLHKLPRKKYGRIATAFALSSNL